MDDGLLDALEASILSAELQPKWRRSPTLGESDFEFSQLALLDMWIFSVGKGFESHEILQETFVRDGWVISRAAVVCD